MSRFAAGAVAGLLMSSSLVGSAVVGEHPAPSLPAVDLTLRHFPGACDEAQGPACGNAGVRGEGGATQHNFMAFVNDADYPSPWHAMPAAASNGQGQSGGSGYAGGGQHQNSNGGGGGFGGIVTGGLGSGLSYYWPQFGGAPNFLPGAVSGPGPVKAKADASCESRDEKNKSGSDSDAKNNNEQEKDNTKEECQKSTASGSGSESTDDGGTAMSGFQFSQSGGGLGNGFSPSAGPAGGGGDGGNGGGGNNGGGNNGGGDNGGGGNGGDSGPSTPTAATVIAAVPEPSALALIGLGLFLLGFGARSRVRGARAA
jgi:hypothetical protein